VHLVDGTYELFRAHYSKRPGHTAPSGQDVKATLGLLSSMLNLLEDPGEQTTHLAIAFDNPIESFRNELFDGYKTGEGIEPELRAQFDLVEEASAALGLVVWRMDRWEADDALATGAERWRDQVDQVRLMTADKDLGQCLVGTQVVQVDQVRNRVIDEAALWVQRGVAPASIPDYLALVGDTADGIPGIPGFGAKTAAALLSHYQHLEAIPPNAEDWDVQVRGAARLASTLADMQEEAALYKTLATLVRDVPLPESLEDLEWRGARRDAFPKLCALLGSERLAERPSLWTD